MVIAAAADALLFADDRLGGLSRYAGLRELALHEVAREPEGERAPHEVQRYVLLLRHLSQVVRDLDSGCVCHRQTPSGQPGPNRGAGR
jgi:hypothetical protein